ncbi:MAG: hypothetical protein LBF22_06510 [Deltaproteobacteria bacterium]|jgi:hypothetical protein|nr:hypothetical protein [Deltaproteobacteria bacterium]
MESILTCFEIYFINNKINYLDFIDFILNSKDKDDKNISIKDIEYNYSKLYDKLQKNDCAFLCELFSEFYKKSLIKEFRDMYKSENIILRTNRKSQVSIQTVKHKLTLNRYLLSPKSKIDKENLMILEGV